MVELLGTLFDGSNTTTPGTSTVLITTGDLAAGYYIFTGFFAASSNSQYNYEVLNSADVVIDTVVVIVLANTTITVSLGPIPIGTNYEVRVRPRAAIGGGNSAAVSIIATLVAIA